MVMELSPPRTRKCSPLHPHANTAGHTQSWQGLLSPDKVVLQAKAVAMVGQPTHPSALTSLPSGWMGPIVTPWLGKQLKQGELRARGGRGGSFPAGGVRVLVNGVRNEAWSHGGVDTALRSGCRKQRLDKGLLKPTFPFFSSFLGHGKGFPKTTRPRGSPIAVEELGGTRLPLLMHSHSFTQQALRAPGSGGEQAWSLS